MKKQFDMSWRIFDPSAAHNYSFDSQDNLGDSETTEWPEWGLGTQEYFPEWCLRESVPEISNDSFSDCLHER